MLEPLEWYEGKAEQQEKLSKVFEDCGQYEDAKGCNKAAGNYREMARLQKDMT